MEEVGVRIYLFSNTTDLFFYNKFDCNALKSLQLTRKNLMAKNLKRLKRSIEREQGKLEASKYPSVNSLIFFKLAIEIWVDTCIYD